MKPHRSNQRNRAMTLTEVLVVVVVLAFLTLVFFPWPEPRARKKAARIICVNNLKQIGLAFQLWAEDNNDKYPMRVSVTNGGMMEMAATGDVVATFQVMSNELSTPKILFCLEDTNQKMTTHFGTNLTSKNISYFIGLDASTNSPQAFLCGDDNFAIGGVPVKSGLLEIPTNVPITWTAARHTNGGNIGLADGSVQQVTISGLTNLFRQTGLTTNRLAIP
jgi:prepilin-type N-terminal cleavage/methylation domain-containing protein/prepilin-type processing-associated H-X9-DG protein